jgi:hypothetical protein
MGSLRVVLLLSWLLIEIVHLEEVQGGRVASIDQNSKLQVVELVFFNTLDAGDFDWVVYLMNANCTVEAEENTMAYTDIVRVGPAAVKAILIRFLLL